MAVAFLGFPRSYNKSKVWRHQWPTVMLQQVVQVSFSDGIYRNRFHPELHICARFDPSDRFLIGSTPVQSPHPNGMSGGLVYKLNEEDHMRGRISPNGIIGIGIEYLEKEKVLAGIHIATFFELLRHRCPELSPSIPVLNLQSGEYALGETKHMFIGIHIAPSN